MRATPPPCSVLVADDDHDMAQATAALLRQAGCNVEVVHDGAEALRAIVAHKPRIAVLDLEMPSMDGCTLARALRARADTAGMRIVALTGRDSASDRAATASAGFDVHLAKPASAEALYRAVLVDGA